MMVKLSMIHYLNPSVLAQYITRGGAIFSRRYTQHIPKYQKTLRLAIFKARFLGLMPFII
jgi:ribosomal protein S18